MPKPESKSEGNPAAATAGRKRTVAHRDEAPAKQIKQKSKSAKAEKPAAIVAVVNKKEEENPLARGVRVGDTDKTALQWHTDDLSSDDEIPKNTIGNVPLEWYKDYDHIGYDVDGQKLVKKNRGDGIDAFLKSQDDPIAHKWRIYDAENDEEIVLSKRDVQIIRNIQGGTYGHTEFDPTSDDYNLTDLYSRDVEPMPLNDDNEPKRRFVPSKWEMRKVMRIYKSIKEGRYWKDEKPRKQPNIYLLWGEDDNAIGFEARKHAPPPIPAPKLPPPGHAYSYNPPSEYLLTEEEKAAWEDLDPSDRPMEFIPQKFSCLRHVPLYSRGIRERFERCLDLYLCPRAVRDKMNVDPDSLLPKLPDPAELRPFPTHSAYRFEGHTGRVRTISADPTGQWLVSGSDDKTVRLWSIATSRCVQTWAMEGVPQCVAWCPNPDLAIIAVAVEDDLAFIYPGTATRANAQTTLDALRGFKQVKDEVKALEKSTGRKVLAVGDDDEDEAPKVLDEAEDNLEDVSEAEADGAEDSAPSSGKVIWYADESHTGRKFPETADELLPKLGTQLPTGVMVIVKHSMTVRKLAWHRKGDYIATVCPNAASKAVTIHQLSKRASHSPFRKNQGQIQSVVFHPTAPQILIANQRSVRLYDLLKGALIKKLESGVKWISSMDIHASGEHIIVGSYDHRTVWFDTELSDKPYKTLRYHSKAVRRTVFHPAYPLMATASDDGSVHVFHAKVFNDFDQNPLIVPVKILKGHKVTSDGLGVLDCVFHPTQPWIITAGADHVLQLWHNLP